MWSFKKSLSQCLTNTCLLSLTSLPLSTGQLWAEGEMSCVSMSDFTFHSPRRSSTSEQETWSRESAGHLPHGLSMYFTALGRFWDLENHIFHPVWRSLGKYCSVWYIETFQGYLTYAVLTDALISEPKSHIDTIPLCFPPSTRAREASVFMDSPVRKILSPLHNSYIGNLCKTY